MKAEDIEYRIKAEYGKHPNLDWAKIASLKIADSVNRKDDNKEISKKEKIINFIFRLQFIIICTLAVVIAFAESETFRVFFQINGYLTIVLIMINNTKKPKV